MLSEGRVQSVLSEASEGSNTFANTRALVEVMLLGKGKL